MRNPITSELKMPSMPSEEKMLHIRHIKYIIGIVTDMLDWNQLIHIARMVAYKDSDGCDGTY